MCINYMVTRNISTGCTNIEMEFILERSEVQNYTF